MRSKTSKNRIQVKKKKTLLETATQKNKTEYN